MWAVGSNMYVMSVRPETERPFLQAVFRLARAIIFYTYEYLVQPITVLVTSTNQHPTLFFFFPTFEFLLFFCQIR